MKPFAMNTGFFAGEVRYPGTKGHLNSADIFEFVAAAQSAGDSSASMTTHLGMIDLFVNNNLYPEKRGGLALSADRKFLDTHEFTWSHPVGSEEFYLLEDLSGFNDMVGAGGETFKLKFNSKKYDNHYILSPDPQSKEGQIVVTSDEIVRASDGGWIFTVRLRNTDSSNSFMPKQFLKAGTRFYMITTIDGEYNQTYSSLPSISGGERKYGSYVGTSGAQLHYSITRDAAVSRVPGKTMVSYDDFLNGVEMFFFKEGTLGWDLSYMTPEQRQSMNMYDAYKSAYGSESAATSQMRKDSMLYTWVPKVEMAAVKMLDRMREAEAMYSAGGLVEVDGPTKVRTVLGLFHQFMLGPNHSYDLPNFSLDMLEAVIASRYQGAGDFYGADNNIPTIKLRTGRGGISLVQNELSKYPARNGLMWTVDGIVQGIGGNNAALHFATPTFGSWRMKNGMANIMLEYEPSLDPQTTNNDINPMITRQSFGGGCYLSSYIFLIDDLSANTTGSNVKELLYAPDWDTRKSVLVGNLAYPGLNDSRTWQRSNLNPGFEVILQQRHKAYWLVDPHKSLIIKPYNPNTGKPIFHYE